MPRFATLDQLNVAGKRVLVRCDLNVPMKNGEVSDATRIERSAATLAELSGKGARVIVLSHLGRPKGGIDPQFSLRALLGPLGAALGGRKIAFAEDCIGPKAIVGAQALGNGDVLVLENLRFHAEEEANDPAFAAALASIGDIYVNDAFSCAHRAHASTEALARLLPSAAGRLMQAELDHLEAALEAPKRPVMAIVGGAKVSTKIDLLGNLVAKVDCLVIGGGMANTFLFAMGLEIGKSLAEREMADTARLILAKAKAGNCRVILPLDAAAAVEFKANAAFDMVDIENVHSNRMILDIGPKSVAAILAAMRECRTLLWNGPLGAFETPPFDRATTEVAQVAARLTKTGGLLSVAGGGDTVAALAHAGVEADFSYVSTAGGAFLEWLEGKELPGVAALKR
jgi:phosphoglycerate kinase